MRPVRWPEARWMPSPNFGYVSGGKPVVLNLRAYVQHSAHTPLNAPPPERFFDPTAPNRGSVHFWYYGNGVVDQMVELDKPAYGNGQLNLADGHNSPIPLVREWYRTGRNPNWETWSSEFTGYGHSHPPGHDFTRPTDEQMYKFVRFAEWSKAEGWIEFGPDTVLLHQNISATACPDGRFDVAYLLNALEDDMDPRLEEMIWRMADILVGEPPADTANAHGDRLTALIAEWANKSPMTDAIRNQQSALVQHKTNHPSGGISPGTTFTAEIKEN